jgi:pimeloyl-ACP methyl ester carboxylesterase
MAGSQASSAAGSSTTITTRAPRNDAGDPISLLVDVASAVPGEGERRMAVDVFVPGSDRLGSPPVVLCCLPGGGVDRRYWDIRVPRDDTYSFGRHFAARGFVVVAADHLGVGESTMAPPGDLTVEVLAAAADHAMGAVLARLRDGSLDDDLPPLSDLVAVGVGHSMGSMLTVEQQATHRSYAALVLLGFGNRGLPDLLPPDLLALADDPDALRRRIPDVWRRRAEEMASAPPPPPDPSPRRDGRRAGSPFFHGEGLPDDVVAAVKAISSPAPGVAAMTSMVPGSVRREMAAIDVPILLANGELDFAGSAHEIVAGFPGSLDVTFVVLPATGHSPHAFPTRLALWARLEAWARSLPVAVRREPTQ